jgi:hypothetical protein
MESNGSGLSGMQPGAWQLRFACLVDGRRHTNVLKEIPGADEVPN